MSLWVILVIAAGVVWLRWTFKPRKATKHEIDCQIWEGE